jgi:hypothetical protein
MRISFIFLCSLLLCPIARAAIEDENAEPEDSPQAVELEKKVANPLSNLKTFSFSDFMAYLPGANHPSLTVFKFKATASNDVGENSFLLHLISLPYVGAAVPGGVGISGFSDLTYQTFFVPRGDRQPLWGFGFLAVIPNGTDLRLSSGKWSLGPNVAILRQSEKWNAGLILAQAWSIAGERNMPAINLLTIQPVLTWFIAERWSASIFNTANPITRNNIAVAGQQWTVPVGLQVTKVIPRKAVPLSFTLGVFANAVRPDASPRWSGNWGMSVIF